MRACCGVWTARNMGREVIICSELVWEGRVRCNTAMSGRVRIINNCLKWG